MTAPDSRPSEEMDRACASLRSNGLDFALLSSLPNVTYVSGWEVPVSVGPVAEFTGWLPFALVLLLAGDRAGWLVVPDMLAGPASSQSRLDRLETFGAFGQFDPVDAEEGFLQALRSALHTAGLSGARGVLGVETRSLPTIVQQLLADEFSGLELREATPSLEAARRIKTGREIDLLRRAVRVADAGQNALLEQSSRSGDTDLDVWDWLIGRMEREVSHPITVSGELVTGTRTRIVAPGGPIGRQIERGDTGVLDISPRVNGYWADCTNTVVFDAEPSQEQRRYFFAARDACEAAMEALRPGARACDAHAAAQRAFEQHGLPVAHYTGHQLGTSVNERPRLVPYDDALVEPNMVFAVEPGAYAGESGSTGARAEKIVLVTESGPEILSRFAWGM